MAEGIIHNPSDIYLRLVPNANGDYTEDLSHAIAGVLHAELTGAWVDYSSTTAGSEATHQILCISLRGVLQTEVITNFGYTDSVVIPLPTDSEIGVVGSRFYNIKFTEPMTLFRSTAPVGKGVRVQGQLTFFNTTTATNDLLAVGTVPVIYLLIKQRAENFRV